MKSRICAVVLIMLLLLAAGVEAAYEQLGNPGFEDEWDGSHLAMIVPLGDIYYANIGNIFSPPHWVPWYKHDPSPGSWSQPEVNDAWWYIDSTRVHSGYKAAHFFTFFRLHDGGFYQRVSVPAGTLLRLTAWAHAWSNTELDGYEWCKDQGGCSCGVGYGPAFILEGEAPPLNGDPWNDAIGNFTFYVGIDPTGNVDPRADTVVWGQGAHIYNEHAQVPAVEATSESDVVTIFLRSRTMWAFKHNDAFWDDVELSQTFMTYIPLGFGGLDER